MLYLNGIYLFSSSVFFTSLSISIRLAFFLFVPWIWSLASLFFFSVFLVFSWSSLFSSTISRSWSWWVRWRRWRWTITPSLLFNFFYLLKLTYSILCSSNRTLWGLFQLGVIENSYLSNHKGYNYLSFLELIMKELLAEPWGFDWYQLFFLQLVVW